LKPGNVNRFSDGHGMTRDDFLHSAKVVTPYLCDRSLSVGRRIQESVKVTQQQVGTNTNIGMLLLYAPIIVAAEKMQEQSIAALQHHLQHTLFSIDKSDSILVFQAIKTANPGGLGHSTKYDVVLNPDCELLAAMEVASDRDSIARQFTSAFQDVFETGVNVIKEFTLRWNSVEWAAVACYMTFLATFPDSHIARKYGGRTAEQVKQKAVIIAEQFKKNDNPENAHGTLFQFDRELKDTHINPGTSADLTAASILVYGLITC
ncbi:MAG: triphosphoribosyl-dephospho-CoA synthase, partial [Gammaproteobacteria bacterium]